MALDVRLGDGLATVTAGDTIVTLWRLPATPARVAWLGDCVKDHARSKSADIIHFMFILSSSSPPGSEARALFQKQISDLDRDKKLRKFIVVSVGDSFWASIVRSIGRTILLLIGKSHLLKIVDSMDSGLASVRQHASSETPPSAELAKAVYALATALDVDVRSVSGFVSTANPP